MSCNCSGNDQTHPSVFEHLEQRGLSILSSDCKGIAGFLVPAPERGILEHRAVLVDGITWEEARKRAYNCVAFKWLPHGYELEQNGTRTVINSLADLRNDPERCKVKRCKQYGDNCGPTPECFCSSNVCHGH